MKTPCWNTFGDNKKISVLLWKSCEFWVHGENKEFTFEISHFPMRKKAKFMWSIV